MTRLEIYAHEALEEPLLAALCPTADRPYSLIRRVAGRGASGSSLGDEVWPETNFTLVLFVRDGEAEGLVRAIEAVREGYPNLGLAAFVRKGFEAV